MDSQTEEHQKQLDALYETIQRLTRELRKHDWISVEDRLPELGDYSVLAYWWHGGIDMVHVEDYFGDTTAGLDDSGKQLYCKWYKTQGVASWMPLPDPPVEECDPQCRSTSEGPCVGCPDE